jgi:hypothetical protein
MRDITTIDWKAPFGKVRTTDTSKQKVFFLQDGIEYDSAGKACNPAQVKKHYATLAADIQKQADEAKEQAAQAQKAADEMLKQAGMNKTQARKAAG